MAKSILSRILGTFNAPEPQPLPEPDEKLALAALLVRVAMSDSQYEVTEISRIDRLLSRFYGLNPIEAAKMRATSEKLEREAPETDRFAQIIRETVSFEARVDLMEALWEVVLADGEVDPSELRVMEATVKAFGLSEADSAQARQMAESRR